MCSQVSTKCERHGYLYGWNHDIFFGQTITLFVDMYIFQLYNYTINVYFSSGLSNESTSTTLFTLDHKHFHNYGKYKYLHVGVFVRRQWDYHLVQCHYKGILHGAMVGILDLLH